MVNTKLYLENKLVFIEPKTLYSREFAATLASHYYDFISGHYKFCIHKAQSQKYRDGLTDAEDIAVAQAVDYVLDSYEKRGKLVFYDKKEPKSSDDILSGIFRLSLNQSFILITNDYDLAKDVYTLIDSPSLKTRPLEIFRIKENGHIEEYTPELFYLNFL